jgi:RimJ/RimL family protein N-acetyltransferase
MDDFPRLELRTKRLILTTDAAHLLELAELARAGIHDPEVQPFSTMWTDVTPDERLESVIDWHRTRRETWDENDWTLPFFVLHAGAVIGTQSISADNFAILRTVRTGSWLGQRHQGQGFGTEMRTAILHFSFVLLGAYYAMTSAHDNNAASNGVSRKLGYRHNGISRVVVRGGPVTVRHYIMTYADWEGRESDIAIEGDLNALTRACGVPPHGTLR